MSSIPFQPGGLGIAFLRQYHQAGLLEEIPLVLHPASLNPVTLAALGEAAEGLYVSSHWNSDLPNPTNEAFMEAWRAAYGDRPATWYAAQGYDVALMVAAGMANMPGEGFDSVAFREGILDGPVDSVRGSFALGPNQHPVQDWYALRAERDANGKLGAGNTKPRTGGAWRHLRQCLSDRPDRPFSPGCTATGPEAFRPVAKESAVRASYLLEVLVEKPVVPSQPLIVRRVRLCQEFAYLLVRLLTLSLPISFRLAAAQGPGELSHSNSSECAPAI